MPRSGPERNVRNTDQKYKMITMLYRKLSPDDQNLFLKVLLIFLNISDAHRKHKLLNMTVGDFQEESIFINLFPMVIHLYIMTMY